VPQDNTPIDVFKFVALRPPTPPAKDRAVVALVADLSGIRDNRS
jgi:hypothetical protein